MRRRLDLFRVARFAINVTYRMPTSGESGYSQCYWVETHWSSIKRGAMKGAFDECPANDLSLMMSRGRSPRHALRPYNISQLLEISQALSIIKSWVIHYEHMHVCMSYISDRMNAWTASSCVGNCSECSLRPNRCVFLSLNILISSILHCCLLCSNTHLS